MDTSFLKLFKLFIISFELTNDKQQDKFFSAIFSQLVD